MTTTANDLFFVHIPKNGGRSIVRVGQNHEIDWGYNYLKKNEISLWHVPYAMYQYPKESTQCFTVIRDPYDRLISAYNFLFKNVTNDEASMKKFNDWVFNRMLFIQPLLEDVQGNIQKFKNDLSIHLLPQFFFTHDANNDEVVYYILRFENLEKEFNALMEEHNSEIRLDVHIGKSESVITTEWLSKENILLINEVYGKDFEIFGYSKLTVEV